MISPFAKIDFGYSSAEREGAEAPKLLLDGYLDLRNVTDDAETSTKFLFLGYKGSGKSAIGERLKLLHQNDYSTFITSVFLEDFPFQKFAKIVRGDEEPEAKYPTAWSWILLIYLLDSLNRDEAARSSDQNAFLEAVAAMQKMGFCPEPNLQRIVRNTAKTSFRLTIPHVFEYSVQSGDPSSPANIPFFVESLKRLVGSVRTTNRHYLVIDGLDDILSSRSVQYKSLGSLIFEVDRLNILFRSKSVPIKIILLCRTDLFERVAGANKNKIRQDAAVELDWYADPRHPEGSMLIQIANLRAKVSLNRPVEVVQDFFPAKIDDRPTVEYLLNMTRHTPRDFLQLLKKIQQFVKTSHVTIDNVKSGCRAYSIDYFYPEILDELDGYSSKDDREILFEVLGELRKREFRLAEIVDHPRARGRLSKETKEKIVDIFRVLYECIGIGNTQTQKDGTTFFTFKYRNRHSFFNEQERIMLHRGFWRALNL